jgi:hypothetical protein
MPEAMNIGIFHNLLDVIINETVQEGVCIGGDGERQEKENLHGLATRVVLHWHDGLG